ncbi:MAG TPA: hypothetical protein PLM93_11885 [Sulfuricurvum sp.]|nr:MAG: hypothetical protein B7X89_10985 [Sulfuricurvum sp. 17-40-25]HQS67876.1 hypothetical protein [Sulfuricurvum sp.]HQT37276.1 hypothetical protein [Sulfuricurvum sp.]
MKNSYLSAAIVFISISIVPLIAEDTVPKKTLAIIYEEGKTPDALFHKAFEYFKKLTDTGELKSAELGTAKMFGEVIDVQTATDSSTAAKYEKDVAAIEVRNRIETANVPYSARFTILSTNLFFGDKSLGYVLNPYRGCYQHDYLAKGIEQKGFKIVDTSENPDITMTIGIDACMSEDEFKEYVQKNTALKIKNDNTVASSQQRGPSFGDDLMRSGSSAQLGTPTGGSNVGVAVAGVGLALNVVSWLTTKSPQERDVIRYHAKFEGKDKKTLDFYPIVITTKTHKAGDTIYLGSYQEAENLLYTSLLAWDTEDKTLIEKIPPVLLEKDVLKATEMMVATKKY